MTLPDGPLPDPDATPRCDASAEDRARGLRRLSGLLQAGFLAFLGVVSLGLLPAIIGATHPALGERLSVAVWVAAPAVPILLLVVAALRLRR